MLSVFWLLFWAGLLALLVAAGVSLRARLRRGMEQPAPRVDDDAIRAILSTGRLATDEDEPLDLREIDDEERRFWSESWEDPDEW
ncbi:MAG: hypothetical protein RJQ04_10410 [Longimicrobiales bacterium]